MSRAPDLVATAAAMSVKERPRFSLDWITRPVFGVALAALAVGAVAAGVYAFAALVAVVSIAVLREWHRIVERGGFAREFLISVASVLAAILFAAIWPHRPVSWIVLFVGAGLVFAAASLRDGRPLWHAAGVPYVGVPALLLTLLRVSAPHAPWVICALFLTVWATDTGALLVGNLVRGPKLVPSLSPNKTWSGTIGGVIVGSGFVAAYVAIIGGNAVAALGFGALISAVAHAGDLFESWVKRRFNVKDSGGLIPGHGGALDRIDSTLAASVAMAVAVFVLKVDPTFGATL